MLRILAALLAVLTLAACPDERKPTSPAAPSSRFDAPAAPTKAAAGFCEKTFPADGPQARKFQLPPLRSPPISKPVPASTAPSWTWVNLWATWCAPCRDEMPLLGRWKETLAREKIPLELTLLSVDAPENGPALAEAMTRGLPGPVAWIRDEAALAPFLEGMLGVKPDDALPIHALVDPAGNLRCVRVGAVHATDYGTIKGLVSGH